MDNKSARFGATRGTSPASVSQSIISMIWQKITGVEGYPWFARVASSGNPADDPSRLVADALLRAGWKIVHLHY